MEPDSLGPMFNSDFIARVPSRFGMRIIRNWQGRLIRIALGGSTQTRLRVLEIGPGHGAAAQIFRDQGQEYLFCDASREVWREMKAAGFEGHCGLAQDMPENYRDFDLIWVSHVLEHVPDWLAASTTVSSLRQRLASNGKIVIISPDYLSWSKFFWDVDWTHGFPTTLRRVTQLLRDSGFVIDISTHHRGGHTKKYWRATFRLLSLTPHGLADRLLTPERRRTGDGFLYSWKSILGWRQILVVASAQIPEKKN